VAPIFCASEVILATFLPIAYNSNRSRDCSPTPRQVSGSPNSDTVDTGGEFAASRQGPPEKRQEVSEPHLSQLIGVDIPRNIVRTSNSPPVSLLGPPQEANRWLARFIRTYNLGDHRTERHSRIDDWLGHLPAEGIRQMCAWERFCMFARELEGRAVGH
jgi:hypothetical protein